LADVERLLAETADELLNHPGHCRQLVRLLEDLVDMHGGSLSLQPHANATRQHMKKPPENGGFFDTAMLTGPWFRPGSAARYPAAPGPHCCGGDAVRARQRALRPVPAARRCAFPPAAATPR